MPTMNLTSAGVISASLVIGVGAAVTIFDAATGLGSDSTSVQSPISLRADERGRDRGPRRFAPCEKPARLIDGVCVTDVTRTVVQAPAAAAPQSAPQAAPPAPPAPVRTRDDDSDDHRHGHDDDHDDFDDDHRHGHDDDDHDDDSPTIDDDDDDHDDDHDDD